MLEPGIQKLQIIFSYFAWKTPIRYLDLLTNSLKLKSLNYVPSFMCQKDFIFSDKGLKGKKEVPKVSAFYLLQGYS